MGGGGGHANPEPHSIGLSGQTRGKPLPPPLLGRRSAWTRGRASSSSNWSTAVSVSRSTAASARGRRPTCTMRRCVTWPRGRDRERFGGGGVVCSPISRGVFWQSAEGEDLAIKVYKTSILHFKDRDKYVSGLHLPLFVPPQNLNTDSGCSRAQRRPLPPLGFRFGPVLARTPAKLLLDWPVSGQSFRCWGGALALPIAQKAPPLLGWRTEALIQACS